MGLSRQLRGGKGTGGSVRPAPGGRDGFFGRSGFDGCVGGVQGTNRVHQQLGFFFFPEAELAVHHHQTVRGKHGRVFFVYLGEYQPLDGAGQVLQNQKAHHGALFGDLAPALGQDARHADGKAVVLLPPALAVRVLHDLRNGGEAAAQQVAHLVQRVAGDVNAGHFLLHAEKHLAGMLRQGGDPEGRLRRAAAVRPRQIEQAQLAGQVLALLLSGVVHQLLVDAEQLRPVMAQPVQRPGLDEAFHRALVHAFAAGPADEIKNVGKGPVQALLYDQLHRALPHVLHAAQPEADTGHAPAVPAHAVFPDALVHVRRQDRDAVGAAVLDVACRLGQIVHDAVQNGGHEGHGMMQLEPGRLHGHQPVGRRVAFVEGIAGKGGHFVVDVLGNLPGYAPADAAVDDHMAVFIRQAVDEILPFFRHDVFFLLGHGAAHQVAAAQTVARQIPHDLHHLLLIDHAAVGHFQNGLEQGRFVVDGLRVVFARDVAGNGLHGAGPVEGDGGDDVLKAGRLHVLQEQAHPAGFQLKHAVRVPGGDHAVYAGIVGGDVLGLHVHPFLTHHVQRVPDDGQSAQPQKVHFQKAQPFQRAHGVLGGNHVVVGLQRHVLGDGLGGDEHARRMGAGVTGHSFQ